MLKILQISETWSSSKKITESEMVFWTFCSCLQMIILFLKMATFGWNNEWSYFFACSHLVMVVVSQFEKVSKNRLHKGINSKLVKLLTSVFSNSFILTLKEMEKPLETEMSLTFLATERFCSLFSPDLKKVAKGKKRSLFEKCFYGTVKRASQIGCSVFSGVPNCSQSFQRHLVNIHV